jgi:outer membrane protein OmpA-like peptidoglycan-associated protein
MKSGYHIKINSKICPVILAIILTLTLTAGNALPVATQNLSIAEVRELIENARVAQADVFSPGHFDKALRTFDKALDDSAAGRDPAAIGRKLEEARLYIGKAELTARQMRESFPDLVDAYEDALTADTPALATAAHDLAMIRLKKVAEKLEKGNLRSATDLAPAAVELFLAAELEAIKAAILGEAREKFIRLDEADGAELTPKLYAQADKNILDVQSALKSDRYAVEQPQRLADEAIYILDHALFMTDWIARLQDDPGAWESLIMQFETYLEDISGTLHLNPKFDRDMALNVEPIIAAIRSIQDDRRHLQGELAQRDVVIGELEAELGKQRDLSGKYVAELEVRRGEIREKQRFEEKIQRITSLLTPEEGSVVRSTAGQSDVIALRLTGMKFPSGSAEIQPQDFALLTRVQQIIREFPERSIEVQGHTDSKGRESENQKLSEERAVAVQDYLVQNMTLPAERIKAVGFGESRPIASNETASGRSQNRRIEIVLSR